MGFPVTVPDEPVDAGNRENPPAARERLASVCDDAMTEAPAIVAAARRPPRTTPSARVRLEA
ncbi:hypothetical protein C1I97_17065 [Streptomyces sp. NTH33]|uniref:hypothetical protein n=1 Tax=Streptomyces sp. NTH33 TaxID=1735453 RepID=UPI000DAA22CD|nr:hypothetical protein [Streptomyces sp. NTH33]PZH07923.1 hypothetical protein C1I97_17065 [Streptomyces sp. NTH33]